VNRVGRSVGLALALTAVGSARASAQPSGDPAGIDAGGRLQVGGAVLAVVALGAAGTGAYFSVRVGKLERDIAAVATFESKVPEEQVSRKVRAGQRAELLQWAGYGTAVAAGAAAAVLLMIGSEPVAPVAGRTPVAVGPLVGASPGARLAGGSLRLTF
jgi:hypothetical protein